MELEDARSLLIQRLSAEIKDRRVLEAMGRVRRELFIPSSSRYLAYEDIPLPIEMGQTISQPYIVALMTEALELEGSEKVLEIGTGSGYQTAILCEMAKWVVSVERHRKLAEGADYLLASLGYTNCEVHAVEKTLGWKDSAPYQAIMVTAAAPGIARELIDQLAEGGRMVIPVGSRYEQELVKAVRHKRRLETTRLGGCRFVPLIGDESWSE
ncbi:protein-L-isoaspartate(D-aspartate) O-methyltransferase [Chloroflexota bacterium]